MKECVSFRYIKKLKSERRDYGSRMEEYIKTKYT